MTNGTPGWKGYYLSAYGIAVKHGYRGTEEEWLQSLKQEAVDAGEEALSGAAMATAAAAGAQAATTTATTAATAANTATARTEAAADLAAKQAELAQKASDSATAAKEGANHAAASATTAASAANTAKSNAEAAAALAEQKAGQANTAAEGASASAIRAGTAATAANSAAASATAAAEQAQTKGDYAKTQGDRADKLLGKIENTDIGGMAADVIDLQEQIGNVRTFVGYEEDDIYGIEVDFANKKFTRLAGAENFNSGADFDSLTPWGGRKRCILADDGVVLAYHGETGYTENGATSVEIIKIIKGKKATYASGTKVQVMVEQPIFYVKSVPVKAKQADSGKGKQYVKGRFYISPTPKVGFTAPKAFTDEHGNPQDKIYLSAYEGTIYDTSANAYLKADEQVADFNTDLFSSIANAKPASGLTQSLTRSNVRKLCNNRGAGWQSHNIFALSVTQWLIMVEYASMDCQSKIGKGVSKFTDDGTNMAVVTGATAGLGNGSGIDPNGGVDGKCSVSYRGEENLWGNIWTWLDCINILAKGVNEAYIRKAGSTVADDTVSGYENFGVRLSHSSGYQSAYGISEEYPEIFLPTECAGTTTFPSGDYFYQSYTYNGFFIAALGGIWNYGPYCGAWCLSVSNASSYRYRYIGGRLLYVPQTKVA